MKRQIATIIDAQASSDGDGVKINRSIGTQSVSVLDPFLLLDELKSDDAADYMGGFPSHPHRGFETVTYMLEGNMRHKDSAGNEGVIRSGDLQWMTAGSGIIHSEMPEQEAGRMWGFQFWINLPAEQKMRAPRYQEIPSSNVPEIALTGDSDGVVRVLAGVAKSQVAGADNEADNDVTGAATDIATNPLMLDLKLNAGNWKTSLPSEHTALIYVYKGQLKCGEETIKARQLAILSTGDELEVLADESTGALVLAAQPLNEPVARYGPFVMNTEAEIQQAIKDFQSGNFLQAS